MRGLIRRAAVAAGAAVVVLGLAVGPASLANATPAASAAAAMPGWSTAPGWSITPSPNPRVPTGQLFWVSCPAAHSCMAVGNYVKASGVAASLAERWDGTSWRILHTPNPPGAAISSLFGVACTTPSACTAVGISVTAAGASQALAERWNGTRWAIQATASPPQGGGSLNGVSCTSARACTAVGASNAGTLAERWNGARWRIQATPNPPQGHGLLSGVSCTSASACIAVGAFSPFTPSAVTLAERWNGARWAIQATPNPPQGGGILAGVSCVSASACIAVGASNAGILAERWNGTRWRIQPAPAPAGAQSPFLNSVACTSPTACTAVGGYFSSAGASQTLAERWNGTRWAVQATPNPAGTSALFGVACASGRVCTAVGFSSAAQTPAAVAERWNGSAWKVQAAPNPPGAASSILFGVACTSPSACTAVGGSTSRSRAPITLAERWDGRSWRVQPTPNPPQGGGSLNGVSCTSARACTAVGGSNAGTVAERWNGTRWVIQPTPNPSGSAGSFLGSVACTSASSCTAVGARLDSAGNLAGTLAERWNGTRWAIQPTPNPSGPPGSLLVSVACTSASFCTAVGGQIDSAGNSVGPLAELWNGTRWTIQPVPKLPGGGLTGVSCTSKVACTAVGSVSGPSSSGPATLAERWDGTKWRVQPTPALSGLFWGVACHASACTAVGLNVTGPGPGPLTLAERWDGTSWTIQPTPNPVAATDINPPVVACPSRSACTAVTGYANVSQKVTLAEQWNGIGQAGPLPASTPAAPDGWPATYLRALLLQPRSAWGRTPMSYRH